MLALAWANLTHHKLRTLLSALAVGIGIMLMLVSKGLASGSIAEVDQRMQSVDAELVVLPAQDNVIFTSGAPFRAGHERHLQRLSDARGPLASAVIPVFFGQVQMGGQQQRLFGVDPAQMAVFLAARRVIAGKLFDRAPALAERVRSGAKPPADMADPGYAGYLADGLELVIDERLQRVGGYHIGDQVQIMGQVFRIVGVVETGVAGRVFAPLQTLREIVVAGEPSASIETCTPPPDASTTAAAIPVGSRPAAWMTETAPAARAASRAASETSTATTRAPRAVAIITADSPTPPQPWTATRRPAATRPCETTAR